MAKTVSADRMAGIIVLALGVGASVGARRLPAEVEFGLGAAFLPFWLGVVLAILGACLVLQPRMRSLDEEGPTWPQDAGAWGRLGAMLALLLGYVILLERLGYGPTTYVFLLLAMLALERRPWWTPVLLAGLATGALMAIFRGWLKAPLPPGPWGF